jgi:hypothetical protein
MNRPAAVVFLAAITLLGGCKKQVNASTTASVAPVDVLSAPDPIPVAADTFSRYTDPPSVDVGLSVDQAYAAIPHRRTAWTESRTTVPADERAYLRTIFIVVDEAIAVRVAGLQNFSQQRFDPIDVDGQFDRLISFMRSTRVPARLSAYHRQILAALSSDRQFFAEWKVQGANFPYAQQIAANGNVQAASAAAHAAYSELMSKYPAESQQNKDAFFDYHCALDFL